MKTKYQIFVSSTFEDLKEQRDLVIKAILEMGHIPVGMEMFSAGDEQQWKLIQRLIDDCDYYIVILAHRYGSLDGDMGYTEKEYDYAVSKGLPALGFVLSDEVTWPAKFVDKDSLKVQKLNDFKVKVKSKIISHWKTGDDLYGKVSIALNKQFTTYPGKGWVRADETVGPGVLTEISRLSKENADLRSKIEEYKQKLNGEEKTAHTELIKTLRNTQIELSYYYSYGSKWEDEKNITYSRLFILLAAEMMADVSTEYIATYIGVSTNSEKRKSLRKTWPVPSNVITRFLADLMLFELVKPSVKKRSVKDEKSYWILTPLGIEIYKYMRLLQLNKRSAENNKVEQSQTIPETNLNDDQADIVPLETLPKRKKASKAQ